MIEDIIKIIGTSAIFLTILTFAIRQLIKNLLTKDIEEYKGEINKALHEHQIKFKELHEKRLKIIEHLYSQIQGIKSDVEQFIKVYAGHFKYVDEEIFRIKRNLRQKTGELESYIKFNRLYLSTTTIDLISKFLNKSLEQHQNIQEDHFNRNERSLSEYLKNIEKHVDTALIEIEKEFKMMIGTD